MLGKDVYGQIYKLFDNVTPIKADCGKLCDKACCIGDDETGMYLFAGEYEFLEQNNLYSFIKSNFIVNGKKTFIAICNGGCNRYMRPLSCRIFPLTPYISASGDFSVIIDPRAKAICPLARVLNINEFDKTFVKNINRAFSLLLKSDRIYSFVFELSRDFDEIKI